MGAYSYPVIPFKGTKFEDVIQEATSLLRVISDSKVSSRAIKIMNISMERAMEGTSMRIVTITMNITKTMEGIEIHDRDRHDIIFRHLGIRHGSRMEGECFHTYSVENLAAHKLLEEIELHEDHEF